MSKTTHTTEDNGVELTDKFKRPLLYDWWYHFIRMIIATGQIIIFPVKYLIKGPRVTNTKKG